MSWIEGRSGAPDLRSWRLKARDAVSGWRPIVALAWAAGLLLLAWIALEWLPLGPPVAALASSFVLVLFWGQLIRSEHEDETQLQTDTISALGRLLASIRRGSTPRDVGFATLRELLQLTGARGLVAALEHRGTGRLVVLSASFAAGAQPHIKVQRVPRAYRDRYFSTAPATLPGVRAAHPCRRFAVFDVTVRDYWAGRLFLLDPIEHGAADRPGFAELLQQCVGALSAARDVPRIRRRAAAHERARLGRELHDGVVQQLATLDLELEVIRRAGCDDSAALARRLADAQARLRDQIRELRQIEERARAYEVDPLQLSAVLAEVVERFRRDTGISARFEPPEGEVGLPPRVCGEIVRIVQEALANVRRHSGARHVIVEFACDGAEWKLCVEDDGQGLRRWGTASVAAGLPIVRRPAVIEERVQSIGGTLRLAPGDGAGARLEIAIARGGPWGARSFESC
jgi:signal transduction histidine kinase